MNDVRIGPALEELVADLPEVDLAQAAWREADVRRLARRRRALVAFVASVAVVVGLGALWVEAGEGDSRGMQQVPAQSVPPDQPIRVPSRTVPTSPPAASQTTPWVDPAGWKVAGDGVWRIGLIDVTRYRDLPTFAGPLGRMAGAASTDLSRLPANESASPASALYLERDPANADGSEYRPVVLAEGRRIRVDAVTLKPLRERLPGGSRAISADGSALVFPQPSRVVIVDLVTRSVHRIVVPDPDLETAGWSVSDPGEVIARSPGRAWRVDLATRTVGPAGPQDVDSRFEVRSRDSGGTTELVLDRVTPAGMTTTSLGRDLGAPVSESVSARGRVALATLGSTGSSAIVVADTGAGPTGRGAVKVLTMQFGIGFPLGWDPSGRYLHFAAGAGGGTYVLVWDVSTGGVYRAARASSDIGTPVPIALGAGYGRQ